MSRRHYSNLAPAVTTTGSLTASATSVTVTSVTGFPGLVPWVAAIERGTASEELVLITAAVGTSLTITRGYGSTTGKAHSSGVPFEHVIDATDIDESNAHVNANSGVHGAVGSVVGTTDTQTLTNKTLSSSKGLATATDPGWVTQAAASGSAAQIQSLDSAGTTTVFQVSRTGALSALSAAITNAVTAASATLTGALSAASATISGALSAASATISGTATVGSLTTAGNVTANTVLTNDVVRRVGRNLDGASFSGGGTEVIGSSHGYPVVNGRRYSVSVLVTTTAASGVTIRQITARVSSGTVTNASQLIEAIQRPYPGGSSARDDFYFDGEFTAGATGTWNVALGVSTQGGAGNTTITTSVVTVYDVGI